MTEFYKKLVSLLDQGLPLAVATIVESRGSTPQRAGGKMIVMDTGETFFSVGGGALEAMVIREALDCIREKRQALKSYSLHEVGDDALGMACGGKATVHIEVVSPPESLVIFGAGHVGRALAGLAGGLGFRLEIVDDRESMLDPRAFPAACRFFLTDRHFRENLPPFHEGAYVVLVTRCHETDEFALRSILDKPMAYLGMIGSKRKAKVVLERMAEDGVPARLLEKVRSPIGVPIGSHLPQEVAVSILAEIIGVRNGVVPPNGKGA